MDERTQFAIRCDFARRCFLEIADADYIAARALFRNDCRDQFLQLAQQALEKYLKAILLFNGVKYKGGHGLEDLFKKCEESINFIRFDDATKKTLNKFDGLDHSRYLSFSFFGRSKDLVELDRTVLMIRRLCVSNSFDAKHNIGLSEKELIRLNIEGSILFTGHMETIVRQKERYKTLYDNLVWNNIYFGNNFDASYTVWAKNAPLAVFDDLDAYEAIKDYVHLPKEIRNYFENKGITVTKNIKSDVEVLKEGFRED